MNLRDLWLEQLAARLQIDSQSSSRSFRLAWSGGMDSTVLAHLMLGIRERFPSTQLAATHFNYGLRGEDSEFDTALVQKLAAEWSIPLQIIRAKSPPLSGIQEWARALRWQASASMPAGEEWVEAHHRDDQLETFLFRLFRGSGLQGLKGMSVSSQREARQIWRPLLDRSKDELTAYAHSHRLEWREDLSNLKTDYDRNYIRRVLLPAVVERFPHAKDSIERTREEIAAEVAHRRSQNEQQLAQIFSKMEFSDWTADWKALRSVLGPALESLLHFFFSEKLKVSLSRDQTLQLASLVRSHKNFTWNAPRDWQICGRKASLKRPADRIEIISLRNRQTQGMTKPQSLLY